MLMKTNKIFFPHPMITALRYHGGRLESHCSSGLERELEWQLGRGKTKSIYKGE